MVKFDHIFNPSKHARITDCGMAGFPYITSPTEWSRAISDFTQEEMRNDLPSCEEKHYTEISITEFCNASQLNIRHIALVSEDP